VPDIRYVRHCPLATIVVILAGMLRSVVRCLLVVLVATTLTTGCRTTPTPTPPGPTTTTSPQPGPTNVFTLGEGLEHDVCGIGLVLKFIPATASSSKADYAVVMYGPIGNVPDLVQDHTGDQPLPHNATHPQQGVVITLGGSRFGVNRIDTSTHQVMLTALCGGTS
jgi:hypothetical protein